MTGPQQPQQHDDPVGEARGQLLQALAVLTTVGEAAARWAVAGAQNRAARAERRAQADHLRHQADRVSATALAEQDRAAHRFMDRVFDQPWLDAASLRDVAELWRTAAMYAASGDIRAREAMRRAEERLRQLNPHLMDAYQRHRAAGRSLADAMRAAAYELWEREARARGAGRARPHGNTGEPPPALRRGANGRAVGSMPDPAGRRAVDELDAATRAEAARLAQGIDPEMLDRVQRQWRSAGHAPAADAAALLARAARALRAVAPGAVADELEATAERAARAEAERLSGNAGRQRRTADLDRAAPDSPATTVDEHDAGLATANGRTGRAEQDTAAAEQRRRLGRAFPPLRTLSPASPTLPTQSAPAPSPRKGRAR